MKKYTFLFLFFLLKNGIVFSQIQRTNFVYPANETALNYNYFTSENDKNSIWFYNEIGVYFLDFATKQTHKIMLYDSVSAKKIKSYFVDKNGQGSIILQDSLQNYYICTAQKGNFKIQHTIYGFNNIKNSDLIIPIYHDENSIFFLDNKVLYQLKNAKIIVLDNYEGLSHYNAVYTMVSDGKNWVIASEDSIDYNGLKKRIKFTSSLIFHQNILYSYSNNKIWSLKISNSKIVSDTIQTFKGYISYVYKQNDSLFVEETSNIDYSRNLYFLDNNQVKLIRANIPRNQYYGKWEDDKITFSYGVYGDGDVDGYISDKRITKNNFYWAYLFHDYPPFPYYLYKTSVENSNYLFQMKPINNYTNYARNDFYLYVKLLKDTLGIEKLEKVSQLNNDLLLVKNNNALKLLNLKTLTLDNYIEYPSNYASYYNNINDFWVGNKNIAYTKTYSKIYLVKDFRNKQDAITFSNQYENYSYIDYFVNDSIISIPQSRFWGGLSTSQSWNDPHNYYLQLGQRNDSLFLFETSTNSYKTIKLSGTLENAWVIEKQTLLLEINNYHSNIKEFWLFKNGSKNLLYEFTGGTFNVFFDKSNNLWLFVTEYKNNGLYQISIRLFDNDRFEIKNIINISPNYNLSTKPLGNDIYQTSDNTNTILRLRNKQVEIYTPFWIGNPSVFWTDNASNVYCLANSEDYQNRIYSTKNPKLPSEKLFPNNLFIPYQGFMTNKNGLI